MPTYETNLTWPGSSQCSFNSKNAMLWRLSTNVKYQLCMKRYTNFLRHLNSFFHNFVCKMDISHSPISLFRWTQMWGTLDPNLISVGQAGAKHHRQIAACCKQWLNSHVLSLASPIATKITRASSLSRKILFIYKKFVADYFAIIKNKIKFRFVKLVSIQLVCLHDSSTERHYSRWQSDDAPHGYNSANWGIFWDGNRYPCWESGLKQPLIASVYKVRNAFVFSAGKQEPQ